MTQQYNFLKTYTQRLIERAKVTPDIGLWSGRMGAAIYLLHLAHIIQNGEYEKTASELIEAVSEKLSYETPFSYAGGLLGVGCDFEYIIANGFVEGDSDEVLAEIDHLTRHNVDIRPFDTLSLGDGVCGIGHYFYHRLRNKLPDDDSAITLKNKEALIYLVDWIEELLLKTKNKNEMGDTYFLLCRLLELNVIHFKIDKMLAYCLRKIADFNYLTYDNYELLGIHSLKLLRQWM